MQYCSRDVRGDYVGDTSWGNSMQVITLCFGINWDGIPCSMF